MREFFERCYRGLMNLVRRFVRNQPSNAYETLAFRAIREAATIYSRRVIIYE